MFNYIYPLLITIILELLGLILFYKKINYPIKKFILIIILINIITNPLLNLILNNLICTKIQYIIILISLEIIVFLAEGVFYYKFTKKLKLSLFMSFIFNMISFLIGTSILLFI